MQVWHAHETFFFFLISRFKMAQVHSSIIVPCIQELQRILRQAQDSATNHWSVSQQLTIAANIHMCLQVCMVLYWPGRPMKWTDVAMPVKSCHSMNNSFCALTQMWPSLYCLFWLGYLYLAVPPKCIHVKAFINVGWVLNKFNTGDGFD